MPNVQYHQFYSHILGGNIDFEITGHWGYPVLMFPTSGGQFTQNRDFGLNGSVDHWTNRGILKLYNVQTIDMQSFYDKGLNPHQRIHNYERYIQFLIQEFVPYIQRENNTHCIATAGASFGAYHASNFAFRFPDLVSHLFSLSGAFSIRNFMYGWQDEQAYFNCPEEFMPNEQGWRYKHMNIVLSTSDQDICKPQNQNMSNILNQIGVGHWYDEKRWISHDWPLWRMVFPEFVGAYFGY